MMLCPGTQIVRLPQHAVDKKEGDVIVRIRTAFESHQQNKWLTEREEAGSPLDNNP